MYKQNQLLLHPADFDNSMFFSLPVTVWQQGEIINYGGLIERHTEHAVYIDGEGYLKETCEFIIR